MLVLPLRPANWTYVRVLTFVGLTAPPAILYALPVERWTSMAVAGQLNLWSLALVAAWRVALLLVFLRRSGQLSRFDTFVVGLLPLAGIVTTLFMLNLHRAVFDLMGNISAANTTAHDGAYAVLFALTIISVFATPVLFLAYLARIFMLRRAHKPAA